MYFFLYIPRRRPPKAPKAPETTVYVKFLYNFHACCAHRAHESRYFHECARHLAPVCRDRKRARVLRAPWSWGAFEKSRPNPVPPLRVSFLDQKIMKTSGMAPGNNLKCTREHFKRRPEFVFARGDVLDVVRNVSLPSGNILNAFRNLFKRMETF
jgi:hypothetical protein